MATKFAFDAEQGSGVEQEEMEVCTPNESQVFAVDRCTQRRVLYSEEVGEWMDNVRVPGQWAWRRTGDR